MIDLSKLIPGIVGLAVDATKAIIEAKTGHTIDAESWKELGPQIQALVEKAIADGEFTDSELRQFIPQDLDIRALQTKKKKERIEAGDPV